MKAITLWEPWASAMALNLKLNETRSWSTSYQGELAICSAKRRPEEDVYAWKVYGPRDHVFSPGCVLCVVYLDTCLTTMVAANEVTGRELEFGDYRPGRFAWMTNGCRRLKEPVPVVGRQGLFILPMDVEAAVRRQLSL